MGRRRAFPISATFHQRPMLLAGRPVASASLVARLQHAAFSYLIDYADEETGEALILYVLGFGSPTFPLTDSCY
jgi:hypothetical protein